MAERGFTDPVPASDVHDSQQTVKPSRWEQHDLLLIWFGVILGATAVVLFGVGLLVIGAIDG